MQSGSASSFSAETIAAVLADSLAGGTSIDAGLDRLLDATGARAAGLWRVAGDRLRQIGFRAVADMPADVRTEFAAATRNVPLTETGLGIVKAAVGRAPAVATAAGVAGLGASAGWLARFACRSSLAVPLEHAGGVVGVLAISTPGSLDSESAPRAVLLDVAARLAASVAAVTD